jgi:hypothetical protein
MLDQWLFTCNGGSRPSGPSRFVGSYIGDRESAVGWMSDYLRSGSENRYNFDGTVDYAFERIVMSEIDWAGNLVTSGVWAWRDGVWEFSDVF